MALSLTSTIELEGGVAIPVLGLGVFQADSGEETRRLPFPRLMSPVCSINMRRASKRI